MRRTLIRLLPAIALPGLVLLAAACGVGLNAELPTHKVQRGDFVVSLTESGELKSAQGELLTAPRVRGRLEIVHLWPEGQQVGVGDLILQFNRTEFEKEVRDAQGELEKAQAEMRKLVAEQIEQMADAHSQVEQRDAALKLAQINLKKIIYGTEIEKQEAQIRLKQAERNLAEAKANLEANHIVHRVNIEKQQVRIARREKNLRRAQNDYDRLSIEATKPGIVVYEKIRKQNDQWVKLSVGDQVWGGTALISLPDLNQMQVLCHIGEIDVTRVRAGQEVAIRLDAFSGPVFHGTVKDIAPMANASEQAANVQVFEVVIDIHERDRRLKPGMSAQAEIIIQRLEDVLWVPLQAVFRRDGKEIVYVRDGLSYTPVEVLLGARNATAAVVESGLEADQQVALTDPTLL